MSVVVAVSFVGAPPSGRFSVRSGNVAGLGFVSPPPQPSHPQGVRRWVPSCFAATLPQPLKGEGVSRAVVGAPPPGRFSVGSCDVAGSGFASPPPQPSHPQGVRRWVPRCFAATLPQPLKGEGAWRAVVGAPPSGRCGARCTADVRSPRGRGSVVVAALAAIQPRPTPCVCSYRQFPPLSSGRVGEGVSVSLCLRGSLLFLA